MTDCELVPFPEHLSLHLTLDNFKQVSTGEVSQGYLLKTKVNNYRRINNQSVKFLGCIFLDNRSNAVFHLYTPVKKLKTSLQTFLIFQKKIHNKCFTGS